MRSRAALSPLPRRSSLAVRLASILAALAALGVALLFPRFERGAPAGAVDPAPSERAAETSTGDVVPLPSGRVPARVDASSGVVRGTLSDERGAPLAATDARLRLTDERGGWRAGSARPDGSFELGGLGFGSWRIECDGDGVRGGGRDFVLSSEAPLAELDLVVERGRWLPVDVRVDVGTDDDVVLAPCHRPRPVVVDEWHAFATDTGASDVRARRDGVRGLGERTQVFVPLGRAVEVELRLGEHRLARHSVGPRDERCAFVVAARDVLAATGEVTLRLVDEAGAPLGDAWVRGWIDPEARCEHAAAADGAVRWTAPPGEASLLVRAAGRESKRLRVRVPSGGELALGDVVLARAHLARGRVVDREGRPCSVTLRCEREEAPGAWTECAFEHAPFSSVEGRFVLDPLGPGRHRVTALVPGSPPTEFACADGVPPELVVLAGPP